jgi:hypothetical protein
MGQLFMKLAPTVTTMLGAKTPSADGSLLVVVSAEASSIAQPQTPRTLNHQEKCYYKDC